MQTIDTGQKIKEASDYIKEQWRSAIEVIEDVSEEICNDYCKYADTEKTEDGTCKHYDDCPLNRLR